MVRGLLALALVGCGGKWEASEAGDLRILDGERTSGLNGTNTLRFDVQSDETAFLVTVDPDSPGRAVFLDAEDPDGDVVYDADALWDMDSVKTGGQFTLTTVSLNWPIELDDPTLAEGDWRTRVGLIDQDDRYESGLPSAVRVAFKSDDDFDNGAVRARIVYVGAVGQNNEVVRATEAAATYWQALYEDFGLSLELRFASDGFDGPVGAPGEASGELYERLSADSDVGEITIVIADRIADNPGIQGYSGGVPGPILPSGRSVMVLSATDNAGGDLVFSDQEVRLLGETLAHEVGHYVGLFHPVSLEYDEWDNLQDTPECTAALSCVTALGENLMYPIPVCDSTGSCRAQTQMTPEQVAVMHRSVWVD